ncbi:MAG: hypothetical protein BJG00_001845 [Limnothrix sp. CACIAM 69d]|nr:MAG: hypothetical protein BJG00_001845 [Limnothrix sp. CACIAM 69d]
MLAYGLAILVAIGSLLLYAIALRFPILSRRSDVIWSSFGLFYALVLWVCSGQLHGAVLLSQGVVVGLIAWQGWQTLVLREQVARSSLDEVLVAALPQFDRWAGLLNLFRPSQPNLTGWQAFRQSLTGLGIVLWLQIQGQLANLRASRSPGGSPAPTPNPTPTPTSNPASKPTPSPTPPPTNAAAAPPAPVSTTTGSEGQSTGQPVYVRKKYRQPPEGSPPTQTTPSPAPSPEPVPEGSKPVYVRKKYRQALENPSPAPNPNSVPSANPVTPANAAADSPSPAATKPDNSAPIAPRPPRPRPTPSRTVKLDGANLPDEVVVDYEELPPRPPRPRRPPAG